MPGRSFHVTDEEYTALIHRLDELVAETEALPFPNVQELIFEMLQCVDLIHREGLNRLLASIQEQSGQQEFVDEVSADPVVRTLLLLYDLVEPDPEQRVAAAVLDGRQPFIALDEIQMVPAEGAKLRQPRFVTVAERSALPADSVMAAAWEDVRVLLVNLNGELFAVGDLCPGSQLSLSSGELMGTTIRCPWHGEQFDVRSGKCLDRAGRDDEPRLSVYPVRVVDGQVQIAVNSERGS